MTPLYIFDLDGTLADLKHRRPLVELQDGSPVMVQHDYCAIYRSKHDVAEDNVWVEFPETGIWAYHKNDITFKKNWDAFHAACVHDTPIKPVINTYFALAMSNPPDSPDVWIWSGRSDSVRAQTEAWLRAHVPWYTVIKMRKAKDYTPDDQLKERWLHAMSPEDRARLVMVFDDRTRVVEMWRRNGVVCAQVAPGGF